MRAGKFRIGGPSRPAVAERVTGDAFTDRDVILKYYEKQADEFRLRHSAVWEEIRHYAWLLTLLLGWPVALLSAKNVSQLWRDAPYFIYLPILALCFSVIAFSVIRREFRYYSESDAKLLYIEHTLGLTSRDEFLDHRLREATRPGFSMAEHLQEATRIGTYVPWRAKIRALFLLEFIIFGLAAAAEIGFCVTAFFHAP